MIGKQYFNTSICEIVIALPWNVTIIWQQPSPVYVKLFQWSPFVVLELNCNPERAWFLKQNNNSVGSRWQTRLVCPTPKLSYLIFYLHVPIHFVRSICLLKMPSLCGNKRASLNNLEAFKIRSFLVFLEHKFYQQSKVFFFTRPLLTDCKFV